MATKWSIDSKVSVVVHDGASNMKETAQSNNWRNVDCANHKLHLAVSPDAKNQSVQ